MTLNQKHILKQSLEFGIPIVHKNFINDLLDPIHFENLINLTPFTNALRFLPTWSTPTYTWDIPDWSSGNDHYPVSLIEHFLDKGICYIKDCSRVNKKINNICSILEQESNLPVDAHIYFSKLIEKEKSFGVHKDEAHNFVIQVQGISHWQIGSKKYENTDRNLTDFLDDDILKVDTEIEPGDMIFVPSGYYHKAKSLSKRISISFPIPTDINSGICEERHWINWNA